MKNGFVFSRFAFLYHLQEVSGQAADLRDEGGHQEDRHRRGGEEARCRQGQEGQDVRATEVIDYQYVSSVTNPVKNVLPIAGMYVASLELKKTWWHLTPHPMPRAARVHGVCYQVVPATAQAVFSSIYTAIQVYYSSMPF